VGFVAQERPAVFGGEDEMNVNGGKGLWHDGKMAHYVSAFQSQRDCGLQPKVAEPARLPWVTMRKWIQPQRGWGEVPRWTGTEWPQPRCGWEFLRTLTQGSSCLATLGFGPESRWDSQMALGAIIPQQPHGHPARDGDCEKIRAENSAADRRVCATNQKTQCGWPLRA
jgi:hypothetical protein